jgi:hypothetical protein
MAVTVLCVTLRWVTELVRQSSRRPTTSSGPDMLVEFAFDDVESIPLVDDVAHVEIGIASTTGTTEELQFPRNSIERHEMAPRTG